MTIYFSDGQVGSNQEIAHDYATWWGLVGTPTVSTDYAHHGSYSFKFDTNGQQAKYYIGDGHTILNVICASYFPSLPTTGNGISFLDINGDTENNLGVWNSAGTCYWGGWSSGPGGVIFTDGPTVSAGKWYFTEMHVDLDGTNANVQVWIDGTSIKTYSYAQVGGALTFGWIGGWDKTDVVTNYVDCVVMADTYIGPESSGVNAKSYGDGLFFARY